MTKATAGGKSTKQKSPNPARDIEELREKVRELEETIDAIRSGEVDAIVVEKGDTRQIYTLEGADHPYQVLVEHIQEGVLNISGSGMILYANQQFATMVKLPLDTLPGTSILDYVCPGFCLEIEDAIRKIQRTGFRIRVRIRHGTSSLPVLISMTPLSLGETTKISVVITDRSYDEHQLQFQAQMLGAVGDAVFALDRDQKIIYWNNAAAKTYGWKPEEVIGHDFMDLTLPGDSKKAAWSIGRYLEEGKIWSGEFIVRHRDGHLFPVYASAAPVFDDDGVLIAAIGTSHDITDRKEAEETLKKNEERYRHLLMYAPAAIYEISPDGLRFLSVNQTMCRILGYTQEELLKIPPFDILDEESKVRFRERVRKRLSGDNIDESVVYRIIGREGREIWATLNIKLTDDGGGTFVIAHDVTERKLAEEQLKKAYGLTSAILESINGSFIALDKNWQFTYVNQRAILPDLSPADVIGTSIWEVFPEIIGTHLETLYREVMASRKPRIYENRSTVIPDRYFELNVYPIEEGGLAIFGQEITERKMSEKALHQAQERTATILEGIADTFYSLDEQWRFTMVNPAAEKAPFGKPAAELLGQVLWDIYPGLVGTRIHQHYLDALEKHSSEHYEAQSPLNGRYYEVFMQGHKGGVDVYMRDISGRKQAEEELHESENRYKELVENANSIIIKMDNEGRISFFNDYAQKFFGYSPDEIIGQNAKILVPPTESGTGRNLETLVNDVLRDPDDFAENVNENIKKNGESVWISWRNSAIRDLQGNVIGNLAFGQDITERREAEEMLRVSEERFRLALRNAPVSVAIQDNDLVFQWAYNQRSIRPDEVKGKKDTDIFAPEDAARLIEMKRASLLTGTELHKKIWLTMNGKRLFLDLYLEPLRDINGHITGLGIATVDLTEQKLIEDALRLSEKNLLQAQELLEAVTKGTDVIIAVQDTNFRYMFYNEPYKEEIKRLTGKDLAIGTNMIELFSGNPEEQRKEIDEWSRVLSGENINRKITFGSGKNHRIYHVLHTPIRDAQGSVIAAGEVAFDITRQAQTEETLRETKEYLDNLITYANAPIIVWDPHFRISLFNHAFEHLTGRKAKEVLGKPLDILFPETYLDEAMDLIRKTKEGERWDSVEIPILHKKGDVRTVLWNSASILGLDGDTIVSTIAQGQDITDRKVMESELKLRAKGYAEMNTVLEEEIRQRKISDTTLKKTLSLLNASLESTADGILVVDHGGNITSYNKNFMNMWNIPEDVLRSGKHRVFLNHVLHQLKNPEGFLANLQDLEKHHGRESFEMIEFIDGKIFERYSKPQKIGNTVVGRVWSFRDITDRKRAEESLVASLDEKEVLLREIHHRVKNNLQLISGLLDMTRMRTVDESTNSILTDLMLKIQTMAQIHTRLYESKQFGKISLSGQIRDQVTALSNIYSHKGHEITCEIAADEIFLPVDQAIPCALVVNEILSNAYKHAFKGRKGGTIEISAGEEDGQIQITVRDDGVGIPNNFDISQANSLGLKLVRTLVQFQLKGSLMFKTRNGTEFTMEFPIITGGT